MVNKKLYLSMAEGPDPFIKLKQQINCPVCLDVFDKPKLLVCNHAFCKRCIDGLPDIGQGKHIVKCPTCRKKTTLPQGGAANLPPAFYINTLMELHNATRGITASIDAEPKVFGETKCLKHDRVLEMFCEDCQELVCTKCFHHHHRDHTGDYVTEILAKHQQNIISHLTTVRQSVHAVLQNFNNQLCAREKEIIDNGEAIKKEIDTLALEIVETVQQSARQMKEMVNMHVQQKLNNIIKEKESGEALLLELKLCEDYIEEKKHTQEILVEKENIGNKLRSVCQAILLVERETSEKANIMFHCSRGITDVYSKIGEVSVNDAFVNTTVLKVSNNACISTANASTQTLAKLDSELAVVGRPRKITLRNVFGAHSISLISNTECNKEIQCKSHPLESGKRCLLFTPANQGVYHIKVQNSRGSNIPCNPCMIRVIPSPEITCKEVRTIKGLKAPLGLAFTRNCHQLLVLECETNTIAVVSIEGHIIKRFHHQGGEHPTDLCITHDGHLLVLSKCCPYVSKYRLSDHTLVCTSGPHPFNWPDGIAVNSSDLVYICDTKNNSIQVLNSDLAFSHVLGSNKSKDRFQFDSPCSIAIDSQDTIFVCDSGNRRIQKFSGHGLDSTIIQTHSLPKWIATDNCNTGISHLIYFTDGDGDVNIYSSDGNFLGRIYSAGFSGVAVDKEGDIYICKYTDGTVCVFSSFFNY